MGIGLPPGHGENAMLDEFADIDLMNFSSRQGGLPSLTVLARKYRLTTPKIVTRGETLQQVFYTVE